MRAGRLLPNSTIGMMNQVTKPWTYVQNGFVQKRGGCPFFKDFFQRWGIFVRTSHDSPCGPPHVETNPFFHGHNWGSMSINTVYIYGVISKWHQKTGLILQKMFSKYHLKFHRASYSFIKDVRGIPPEFSWAKGRDFGGAHRCHRGGCAPQLHEDPGEQCVVLGICDHLVAHPSK